MSQGNPLAVAGGVALVLAVIVGGGFGSCALYNTVRVTNATSAGKAELAQAVQNRQIKTLEAKAKVESARFEAQAEIERARGVAAANDIIMGRLGGAGNYLKYLQIQQMADQDTKLIYVPTEGNLPLLEAGRATK